MSGECECVVFDQPCEKCQEAALELNTFRARETLVQWVIARYREVESSTTEGQWQDAIQELEEAARKLAEFQP